MKDVYGKELHIGDTVIFIRGANKNPSIAKGRVTKIYEGYFHGEECSVDGNAHILSNRIAIYPIE